MAYQKLPGEEDREDPLDEANEDDPEKCEWGDKNQLAPGVGVDEVFREPEDYDPNNPDPHYYGEDP